ncbi:thioredoxin family protein [Candidatus Nephthysia bennettiae]|uniref:thioredoxin family protein n=1 Tax=Candidatus Nephthysia bennettiae TaxID=3127016 RepID=UPI003312FA00
MRRRRPGHGHDRREAQLAGLQDVSGGELERRLHEDPRLVLVAFWTPGCEPCRELRGQLSGLETEVATLLAVNADREPQAVAEHGVEVFPTLVFFKGGQELRRIRGGALPASTVRMLGFRSPGRGCQGLSCSGNQ